MYFFGIVTVVCFVCICLSLFVISELKIVNSVADRQTDCSSSVIRMRISDHGLDQNEFLNF